MIMTLHEATAGTVEITAQSKVRQSGAHLIAALVEEAAAKARARLRPGDPICAMDLNQSKMRVEACRQAYIVSLEETNFAPDKVRVLFEE